MAQNKLKNKSEVFNPVTMLSTVGQELEEIFKLHGKNTEELGIKKLSDKKHLTERQIQKACSILNLGDDLYVTLNNLQESYKSSEEACKISYKNSLSNFKRLKSISPLLGEDFDDEDYRMDDILNFFGVDSEDEIFENVHQIGTLYRIQNQTNINELNLCGWIRRAEVDFQKCKSELPQYNKSALQEWIDSKEWANHIEDVDYFKSLPTILKRCGVFICTLPYLNKTVYGAVKWIESHPIIMLSDRDQDLATCWFTLFHEFGHVLLHENIQTSIDSTINTCCSKTKSVKIEREANKFANRYLFNGDSLRKHIFELKRSNDYESAEDLCNRYKVHPLFVGYWMRKAQYYPAQRSNVPITFHL